MATQIRPVNVKEAFLGPLLDSTIHGIPNIISAKVTCVKLVWLFFFMISISTCAFVIVENIMMYMSKTSLLILRKII